MSAAPLEQEFKFRLTLREWKKLAELGRRQSSLSQTNHYFDVLPALPFARSGVGVRVRKQNTQYVFTVKMPAPGSKKGYHVKREWEARLTPARALAAIKGKINVGKFKNAPGRALQKNAKTLPLPLLKRIGQMKNTRLKLKYPGGLSLELDKFSIGSKWYYEAECETTTPAADLKKIKALWKAAKIPLRRESQSKLKRFLLSLRTR